MSAAGILEAAYTAQIVPEYLYGKTQWKTLQARLSEDILLNKQSAFFRTEPGYFFLVALTDDPLIPEKYKERFEARRRIRDLHVTPFLAVTRHFVEASNPEKMNHWTEFMKEAEIADAIRYLPSRRDANEAFVVWTFSIVRRETKVLAYRTGRYRSDGTAFANKRTIGFPGVVSYSDNTLFSRGDYGARENALNAVTNDLDISAAALAAEQNVRTEPIAVIKECHSDGQDVLLLVMDWECPAWFEPATRRLSLNELHWLDLKSKPNHLDDFEPWARTTIDYICKKGGQS
jgi:hypothetical protein